MSESERPELPARRVRPFFIAGAYKGKGAYADDGSNHFVFCHSCESGKTGMLPPWQDRTPSTWKCFDCGALFSVHSVTEPTSQV